MTPWRRVFLVVGCLVLAGGAVACGGDPDIPSEAADVQETPASTPTPAESPTTVTLTCEELLPTEEVVEVTGGNVEFAEGITCEWRQPGEEFPFLTLDYEPGGASAFDDQVSALEISSDEMISGVGDQAFLSSDILTFTKGEDLVTMAGALGTGVLDQQDLVSLATQVADRL